VSGARRAPHEGLAARGGHGAAGRGNDQRTVRREIGRLFEGRAGQPVRHEIGDPGIGQAGRQPFREGVRKDKRAPGHAQHRAEAQSNDPEADEQVGRRAPEPIGRAHHGVTEPRGGSRYRVMAKIR
jgi:hypothetical protein